MGETTGEILASYVKQNSSLLFLDISFNDFNYKHITSMELRIQDNNAKYKAAAVDRYKSEIEILNVDRAKLESTEQKLDEQIKARKVTIFT